MYLREIGKQFPLRPVTLNDTYLLLVAPRRAASKGWFAI